MDGFGDNFVPNGDSTVAEVDPAADFLAREQEELSGLEDPPVILEAETVSDDGLPEDIEEVPSDEQLSADAPSDMPGASEPEPVVNPTRTPERVITPVPRIDPEAIRVWREDHQKKLVEKDAAEEKAKEDLRQRAKEELADWYKQHDEQVAKTRQANRCAEKELVADTERPEPGTEWERISKLCDFNPKTAKSSRDVSRMRSIILHVKQNPPVKA